MRKRIDRKTKSQPDWLQLSEEEKVIFCGYTPTVLKNPLCNNTKHFECAVLTNKRLITLAPLGLRGGMPAVTMMPLSKINAIQTTAFEWNAGLIILCIILCLFYIFPGVIFFFVIHFNRGIRVNAIAGVLRTEIKFHSSAPELAQEFITYLSLYSSHS